MRRREPPQTERQPAPCGHEVVTFEGESAPACLWGQPGYPPLPLGALDLPVFAVMERSSREHWERSKKPGQFWTLRADLLDPFGDPYGVAPRPWQMSRGVC